MALLKQSQAGRVRYPVLALLVFTTAAGCALVNMFTPSKPFAFSHRVHVVDESLECADCHRTWETDDNPGMPTLGQCMLCHEQIDADKPPERQVTRLFDGKEYRATRASRLEDEVLFSHKQHAAGPVECSACHRGIESNEVIDRSMAVRMDDCTACHGSRDIANECATCHREVRSDRPPATHAMQWLRLHGPAVRAHSTATADRCSMCHQESSCASCHLDTPPANHTNYFRLRGHGLFARMDRQNCSTCHRSDSCDSCHRETRPLNHTGNWGGVRSNHCLGCHFPLGSDSCATCHQATPSHALATPLPPTHTPGMNCRQCHGITAPLPHVDKGDNCIQCHR
jgi:hypothetical protein